jgi:hypothetical protein
MWDLSVCYTDLALMLSTSKGSLHSVTFLDGLASFGCEVGHGEYVLLNLSNLEILSESMPQAKVKRYKWTGVGLDRMVEQTEHRWRRFDHVHL